MNEPKEVIHVAHLIQGLYVRWSQVRMGLMLGTHEGYLRAGSWKTLEDGIHAEVYRVEADRNSW